MIKFFTMILLSLCIAVYCGKPPEETPTITEPTEETGVATIAYNELTEPELEKFIKTFPVAKAEIEKSGKDFKASEESVNIKDWNWESWLGEFADINKEIAGLDGKLKAAGMSWNDFFAAFTKTYMASIAIMMDEQMDDMDENLEEMKAQLDDPKLPEPQKEIIKAALKAMEEMKKIYDKVPQANRDLVKKHWDEISKLFDMD